VCIEIIQPVRRELEMERENRVVLPFFLKKSYFLSKRRFFSSTEESVQKGLHNRNPCESGLQ
jgi:hypothetical protein